MLLQNWRIICLLFFLDTDWWYLLYFIRHFLGLFLVCGYCGFLLFDYFTASCIFLMSFSHSRFPFLHDLKWHYLKASVILSWKLLLIRVISVCIAQKIMWMFLVRLPLDSFLWVKRISCYGMNPASCNLIQLSIEEIHSNCAKNQDVLFIISIIQGSDSV